MKLAKLAGLEVPDHGMVRAKDGQLVYWIRRFDRTEQKGKIPVEDFAQLSGVDRETKYDSSVEKVITSSNATARFRPSKNVSSFKDSYLTFWLGMKICI